MFQSIAIDNVLPPASSVPGLSILCGDALAHLKQLGTSTFDGCLTDPPYGLSFMGKAWDKGVPSAEVWAEVLRVLKPGSFLLAFGGTRTYHRLTCAIEDAGFDIRDCLIWLYGSGFPKGKGCLKPAWEPIILARKKAKAPLLNIDGCRIGTTRGVPWGKLSTSRNLAFGLRENEKSLNPNIGRWPANVLLDEESARLLDEQSGTLLSGGNPTIGTTATTSNIYGKHYRQRSTVGHDRKGGGGASRFFYVAKASQSERGEGNTHPCVKPIKLAEHLAKLILPAGESKRLLVPFSGSGSEMIGAKLAGWDHVTGIEREPEFVAIANRRIAATQFSLWPIE